MQSYWVYTYLMGVDQSNLMKLRLQRELQDLEQNKPMEWKIIKQSDNKWDIWITTNIETPFHSIPFKVTVTFPPDYPSTPPKLIVEKYSSFFHPNVSTVNGAICEQTIKKVESNLTIRDRVDALVTLLSIPNPYSALNSEAAKMYKANYNEYYRFALHKFRGYE